MPITVLYLAPAFDPSSVDQWCKLCLQLSLLQQHVSGTAATAAAAAAAVAAATEVCCQVVHCCLVQLQTAAVCLVVVVYIGCHAVVIIGHLTHPA
jgi:hypothetical protein